MKRIRLTQGKIALVDDEDLEKANQFKWHYSLTPDGNGYARGMVGEKGKRKREYLHRFLINAQKGEYIDHRNGNTLDCQKKNIRKCTNQQNAFNIKSKKKNKSGYKGVTLTQYIKTPYQAHIMFNGKGIFIGGFSDPIEAARAYDKKAKELFGEFANTNF